MSIPLVLSFEPHWATDEPLWQNINICLMSISVESIFQTRGCFAKVSSSAALPFSKAIRATAQSLNCETNNNKMSLGQWSGHQVFDLRTKSCWPETQAALVFSCLLSAEIVDTVNYTVIVWSRVKNVNYMCVCVLPKPGWLRALLHWYSSALILI